ncbi:hypothetical protein NQD34_015238 [Periophthalmus magnuspinnatus]|nr:hypothetical protein NQD34_015238 [Periophthalmus magnuspinnatus]
MNKNELSKTDFCKTLSRLNPDPEGWVKCRGHVSHISLNHLLFIKTCVMTFLRGRWHRMAATVCQFAPGQLWHRPGGWTTVECKITSATLTAFKKKKNKMKTTWNVVSSSNQRQTSNLIKTLILSYV